VRLTENVQRNRCRDVITVHAALGEEKTVAFLEAERHHTGLNRIRFEPGAAVDESHLESCLVYPCDDLLNAVCPGRQVDLLKIDVEGAELLVLRGASQALASGKFKRIFVEITDKFLQRHGHTSDQLYRFMKQFRYSPTVGLLSEFQYDEIFERMDDAEVAYVGKD
jgi:FkbM family methyltransferase